MNEYGMCRLAAAAGVSLMAGCGPLIGIRDLPSPVEMDADVGAPVSDTTETGNSDDAQAVPADADGGLALADADADDGLETYDVDGAFLAETASDAGGETSHLCGEMYANDGASTETVPCQTGDCVAGQQVCCYRNGNPDICVGAAQCEGLPMACLGQAHCEYAGTDAVCCLFLDDAGAPTAARCTPSACCAGAKAAVLCGDPAGTCPSGLMCNASITAAGSVLARCN